MSFCKHCIQGVRHEGVPEGKFEIIGNIKTYVATPSGECPKDKAILFLTDGFGPELDNNLLLADDFARNGFRVYLPDLFDGDPVPAEVLSSNGALGNNFDFSQWISNHSPAPAQAKVEAVVDVLKSQGVTRFGAIGYCYGGRLCFNLAFENKVHAVVGNHPSMLELSDIDKYAETASAPLLLNTCEIDPAFTAEKQSRADEVLGGGRYKPGYERIFWPGATHGFAVRGDLDNPQVKEAKEGAFKSGVEWFIKYL
ncbi:dienelactone hydrolase endo-1,3,1,4-beta-D-glucanase [Dentipellis sp. KUC8613]|nr:dienelactone hydrolase endo-1,3,1,4-beta-D-glucanase [Dentipellis sp. KUC8613]